MAAFEHTVLATVIVVLEAACLNGLCMRARDAVPKTSSTNPCPECFESHCRVSIRADVKTALRYCLFNPTRCPHIYTCAHNSEALQVRKDNACQPSERQVRALEFKISGIITRCSSGPPPRKWLITQCRPGIGAISMPAIGMASMAPRKSLLKDFVRQEQLACEWSMACLTQFWPQSGRPPSISSRGGRTVSISLLEGIHFTTGPYSEVSIFYISYISLYLICDSSSGYGAPRANSRRQSPPVVLRC